MISAELRFSIADVYADYASSLDEARYDDWLQFFSEQATYVVQPRENYENNLPLATLRLTSKAMIRDRVYGITETLYHAPYYQRHIIGPQRIRHSKGEIFVEANYIVTRTHCDQPTDILSVGRYIDRLIMEDGSIRFVSKLCVFDTELIPNSLIYPI